MVAFAAQIERKRQNLCKRARTSFVFSPPIPVTGSSEPIRFIRGYFHSNRAPPVGG